jgi:hypothetical protein
MNPAAVHRQYREVKVLSVRSLRPEDLPLLNAPTAPTHTRTLRDRHHHMAWLIALGKNNLEVARECRCSPGRIAQHKQSPAFADLIAKYGREIQQARLESAREVGARAGRNMAIAEDILGRELEAIRDGEAPTPSLRDLNRIATDRMDRFGYPKKTLSDSRTINVNFAANLEAAIARSRSAT